MHGLQWLALLVDVEPELAPDFGGRGKLVAGDHDHAQASLAAVGDAGDHLVAQRIDHADEAHESQAAGQIGILEPVGQIAESQPQHAQRAARQRLVRSACLPHRLLGHGSLAVRSQHRRAGGQHTARRALRIGHGAAAGRGVRRHHQHGLAAEGQFADARIFSVQRVAIETRLLGGDDQCRFGRIAQDTDGIAVAVDLRVVAQGPDAQGQAQPLHVDIAPIDLEQTLRHITGTGHIHAQRAQS